MKVKGLKYWIYKPYCKNYLTKVKDRDDRRGWIKFYVIYIFKFYFIKSEFYSRSLSERNQKKRETLYASNF